MPSPFVPVYSADRALRAVQDRVQRATKAPVQSPALRTESFDAAAGATYRVRATTASLLDVRLPKSDASTFGKTVTLLVDRTVSAIRVTCPTGTVNGSDALKYALTAVRRFVSDGDGGWVAESVEGYEIVAVTTANAAATNATTNLTCSSYTIPAQLPDVETAYRLNGWFVFDHTAAATPTLTAELLIAGAVVESAVMTPVATAFDWNGKLEALIVFRTTGAGGTVKGDVMFLTSAGINQANCLIGNRGTTTDAINTTIANAVELRVRMTTAVASNTLTVVQGYVERLA